MPCVLGRGSRQGCVRLGAQLPWALPFVDGSAVLPLEGSVHFPEAVTCYPPRAFAISGSVNLIKQNVSVLSKQSRALLQLNVSVGHSDSE